MVKEMAKGKFITLYGINNIGKSTHAKLLVERFEREGFKAKYVKYPVYDLEPTGPFLNAVLRGGEQKISEKELQMWFILNRYQFEEQLKQWIGDGFIVVAEDYVGTGIAWGTAKGLDRAWLTSANDELLKEDLAILMEGERDNKAFEEGHVHEQNGDLVEKCRLQFSFLADDHGWRRLQVQPSIEATADMLWQIVMPGA
ncbi:hypothetical protein HY605_05920 [Candidatus Peregrinibacteria bacterium]|nr:hypothetical protein [Candidatus Peregrinibacteria bacterium]